jgi:glycosyltransferase involved in cell wall biosynthesis
VTGRVRLVVEVPPTRIEGSERLINELADDLAASGVAEVLRVELTWLARWKAPFGIAVARGAAPVLVHYFPIGSLTRASAFRSSLWRGRARGAPMLLHAFQFPRGGLPGALTARAAVGRDGAVATPSAHLAEHVTRLGVRVFQIPPGVDCDWFRPPQLDERARSRVALGIQPAERVVLHVGHLQAGRNLGVLAELTNAGHVVMLVVSPRFPPDPSMAAELRASGVRLVTDKLPDIRMAYWAADSYVFPTIELNAAVGVPLSVLEALACGVPVVTTPFDGLPDAIGQDCPGVLWAQPTEMDAALRRVGAAWAGAGEIIAAAVRSRCDRRVIAGRFVAAYENVLQRDDS